MTRYVQARWLALGLLGAFSLWGASGCGSLSELATAPGAVDQASSGVAPLPVGDPGGLALAALTEVRANPVPRGSIDGNTLLTRISLVLLPGATLADLRDAAKKVDASGIAFSQPGSPFLDLEVPRQNNALALLSLAESLQGQRGILLAEGAQQFGDQALPSADGLTAPKEALNHLLVTRFPGAWNLKRRADLGPKIRVVVADNYGGPHENFDQQLEGSVTLPPFDPAEVLDHGFKVVSTLAARFDSLQSHAANPSPRNLDIRAVALRGLSRNQGLAEIFAAIQSARGTDPVIVNLSVGFNIGVEFESLTGLGPTALRLKLESHYLDGLHWASLTRQAPDFEDRVLLIHSAGNDALTPGGQAYPGIRSSELNSPFTIATVIDSIERIAQDELLWNPPGQPLGDLRLDQAAVDGLVSERTALIGGKPAMKNNLLRVGCTTRGERLEDLTVSAFCNDSGQLFAVGEGCHVLQEAGANPARSVVDGTSFAAPQVAGLAAYLWQLDDTLSRQPVAQTVRLLQATARGSAAVPACLDAYGACLALDARRGDLKMRQELIDVVGSDFKFNELDLQDFERIYALNTPAGPPDPADSDDSRHDLNGDGFTGGSRVTRFDLNAGALGQDGSPIFSSLQVNVEGSRVTLNEEALTDLDILKYFAYATGTDGQPLFYDASGPNAISERRRILGSGPSLMTITAFGGTTSFGTHVLEALGGCDPAQRPVFLTELELNQQTAPLQFRAGSSSFQIAHESPNVATINFSTSLAGPVDCPQGDEPSQSGYETFLSIAVSRPGLLRIEKRTDLTSPPTVQLSNLTVSRPFLEERFRFGVVANQGPINLSNFRVATITFTPDP
ncbi:S8 family serine peptidase [bacterium]|nr:S8 family serine peptidase [bacterium]